MTQTWGEEMEAASERVSAALRELREALAEELRLVDERLGLEESM